MNNKSILNYSLVAAYTVILVALSAVFELIFIGTAAPEGLIRIGEGLAEVGFSVTVIAVSILAVITNISERRFFGIKAGEYLKFRRRKLSPGFYDVLVIIVLIGALQYAALAFDLRFAAAFMFIEIIALLIIELRWGLGIAFFYYGKEKEIRSFIIDEIRGNLKVVGDEKAGKKKKERSELAVTSRVDNLFTHTKNAVSVGETAQAEQNLLLMAYLLGLLLDNEYQSVWHNYETRVDRLISTVIDDEELSETAVNALVRMTDAIIATKESDDKQIAKNCDFDRTRNESFRMVTYSSGMFLEYMFTKQIFFRLIQVKIYGIKSSERKAARYAHYTEQFAQHIADSKNKDELLPMLEGSLRKIAPHCFEDGRATDTAMYFCLLISALDKEGIVLSGLWDEPKNGGENHETQKRSLCMLKTVLGIQNGCDLTEQEKEMIEKFEILIKAHR